MTIGLYHNPTIRGAQLGVELYARSGLVATQLGFVMALSGFVVDRASCATKLDGPSPSGSSSLPTMKLCQRPFSADFLIIKIMQKTLTSFTEDEIYLNGNNGGHGDSKSGCHGGGQVAITAAISCGSGRDD